MKLIATEGCVCGGLTIDGKDPKEYSIEEKLEMLCNFYRKLVENGMADPASLLYEATVQYGDSKFVRHCDECGDNIYDYEISI